MRNKKTSAFEYVHNTRVRIIKMRERRSLTRARGEIHDNCVLNNLGRTLFEALYRKFKAIYDQNLDKKSIFISVHKTLKINNKNNLKIVY